jgi:hypothetical protein
MTTLEYLKQIETMSRDARSYLVTHPTEEILVSYNFSNAALMIYPITEALKEKLVTVNDAAQRMFQALGWLEDRPDEPTILMVRAALEIASIRRTK